jgi:uncharacterized protein YecT (DUF1311 family)
MRLALILIFIAYAQCVFSDDKTTTEVCEGPETSSRFEACVLNKQTEDLDAKLNIKYQELLRLAPTFSPSAKNALIESERAWIRYRDKTCDFQQQFLDGINSISWARCMNLLTNERLKYLVLLCQINQSIQKV